MEEKKRVALFLFRAKREYSRLVPKMVEVNWGGWKPAGNKIREVTVSEYMGVIWATIRISGLTLSAVGEK